MSFMLEKYLIRDFFLVNKNFSEFSKLSSTLFFNSLSLRFTCFKYFIFICFCCLNNIFECRVYHLLSRFERFMRNCLNMCQSLFLQALKVIFNFLFFLKFCFHFFLDLYFSLILMFFSKISYLFF